MKCPNCFKELYELGYASKVQVTQTCTLGVDGELDYSAIEDYGDHIDDEYFCRECGTQPGKSVDEAKKILKKR
jgi:hypothetical protein